MEEQLKQLGLTENESRIYLALLTLGECTLGPIEKETGLFKRSAYNVLESLERKSLITWVKKHGVRYFSVTDPEVLLDQIGHQQRTAERLIPELHILAGSKKYISGVRSYRGIKALHAFHHKVLHQLAIGACVDVLGAGGDEFLKIAQKNVFFQRYENMRLQKKISHNLLMYENQRRVSPEYTNRRYVKARFLPEVFSQPIATQVWPDRVSILLFGEQPEIIEIKSEKIRNGFKSYFDVLWKTAKP
jgi:predicted DNA-binding transcriptional regulator